MDRLRGGRRVVPDESSKPCREFQRQGTCKFGKRCRYSHMSLGEERKKQIQQGNSNANDFRHTVRTNTPRDGKLQEWKRLLFGSQHYQPEPTTVSRFFQLGLDLMEGDVGASQEAIKLLVTEAGLSIIKSVLDRQILTARPGESSVQLWTAQVKPLLQLVTHPRIIDSAVLEQEVAAIFNFMSGISGSRMKKLFDYIVQMVSSWPVTTDVSRMATVELSLAVLSKMLDCNTTNLVNDNFPRFVANFAEIVDGASQPGEDFSRLQASKYLDYIRQRLDVGNEITALQDRPQASMARESFVLRRDLPGRLSPEGPRHDNDQDDISKIQILPTYDEIMSPRGEYLPTNDSSQWHIPGIHGRLDREFRLVREDTVGQLRDAVRETLQQIRNPNGGEFRRNNNSVRTYMYDFPTPTAVEFDRIGGLELVVRCNQPAAVQKLGSKERADWWLHSKRLQAGALVCLLDARGTVIFGVVSNSTMRNMDDKKARQPSVKKDDPDETAKEPKRVTLSEEQEFLYVKLQLIDADKHEVSRALKWYRNVKPSLRRYLVEFPGVLLDAFKHTLSALQQMHSRPNIPFSGILAPSGDSATEMKIETPLYAKKAGFTFDLKCLINDGTEFNLTPQTPSDPAELAARSNLDLTQSAALLNTLSRELSLIQGPPGTGKSYTGEKIIKVLLANKKDAKLGPILCVCYTNHALDQLLEHLLDDGHKGIIRIGSQSKSERLQGLNLRTVAGEFDQTRSEKSSLWNVKQIINGEVQDAKTLLTQLAASNTMGAIKTFLYQNFPNQHNELFGITEDGWETVTYQPEQIIDRWLAGGSRENTETRLLSTLEKASLLHMNNSERAKLHRHWRNSIIDPIVHSIVWHHQQYTAAVEQRDRVRRDVHLRCLQQADIVGVTTTGLARNLDLLRKLRCKVMLCEEAGEVLEAHILTALLPSVEQAILIGDHLQLRPQIQNYELQSTNPLGKKYSLDMSLFERLVQPPCASDLKFPYSTLETQRRMHPSIAELVRSTLYPSLKDAEMVTNYPNVVGMKKRLFWLHHEHLEAGAESNDPLSTSRSNNFEVEMTAALVSHLIRQGEYSQGDIAVITPYLGQLHKLRRRMEGMVEIHLNERDLEDLEELESDNVTAPPPPKVRVGRQTLLKSVRVATVDNFQGEEAKVIVISLVRSNPQRNCGFLSTPNRINVLLSRAQHGMYIIGNSDTYKKVPMWSNVVDMLEDGGNFGTSLDLQCPRHPDTPLPVSEPKDFLVLSPESGCILACDKRLHCGHSCTGRCHSDVLHAAVHCMVDCPRSKKGCNHPCPLRCFEACQDKCYFQLQNLNLTLPCGHQLASAKCWEAQNPSAIRCMEIVTRTVPGCNHQVKVRCHEDVTSSEYRCKSKCGNHRGCGHSCDKQCFFCNVREKGKIVRTDHGICKEKCGRNYSSCRHDCSKSCHSGSPCAPCDKPCEVRCSHSKCNKLCNEPCAPCAEGKCDSSCPHVSCKMPCAAPCDWVPCSKRCENKLSCGHQCPSLCGESCPESKYCQQCGTEEVKSTCVDFLEMKEYHEIDLNEDPCVFPDCGHFLTVSSMDGQMDMASHYEVDDDGRPTKIEKSSEPFSMGASGVKVCANCRGSLRNISRYGRIVRRVMLDEATKKFVAWSNTKYAALAESLLVEHEKLETSEVARMVPMGDQGGKLTVPGSRVRQLQTMQTLVGNERYKSVISLWKKISKYSHEVRKEEQPFQRVADLVQFANRQHMTEKEFRFDESVIQVKGYLLASALLLKCDIIIFSDFIKRCEGSSGLRAAVKANLTTHWQECAKLIKLAHDTTHPREEVQGHLFAAQLCGISITFDSCPILPASIMETFGDKNATVNRLKDTGLSHVRLAREVLQKHASTSMFTSEIDSVENMLNDGFYRDVTQAEMRAVYKAMAREFRGTGHWYTCENGHPFTIGECGMAMQRVPCPECGAPVGGQNHQAAEGVRLADHIEQLARDVDGLEI